MEFLSDFLNAVMIYNEGNGKAGSYFQKSLNDLNSGLAKTVTLIDELNGSLSVFCYEARLFRDSQFSQEFSVDDYYGVHGERKSLMEAEISDDRYPRALNSSIDLITRNLESVSKMTESIDKLSQAFEMVPKGVEKFTKGLRLAGNASTSLKGITELLSAGEKGASVTEGIAGIGDIIDGVAEAGAVAGPEGILIAGAAIITASEASAAYKLLSGSFQDKATNVEKFKSGVAHLVWREERKKDFENLMGYNKVHDLKGLNDAERETDSDYMVTDRIRRVDAALEDIKVSFPDFELRAGKGNFPVVKASTNFRQDRVG